jgi:sigma-B regulation protein RsbU (phosphoserine phosphatase)
MVLGALSTEFRSGTRLQEVLTRVNRLLCEKSLCSQFVTLFLFSLGTDGEGQYISAGHNRTWLFRSDTGKIEILIPDAPVLGIFPAASYPPRAFNLCKGDILVVNSDGLTDAENLKGELFGEKRLREIIQREAPCGSKAVEEAFLGAIEDFTQGMPQTDDITFLVVEKSN